MIQVGNFTLDYYQERTINKVRTAFAAGKKRILIVAPTGFGKTILTMALAQLTTGNGKSIDFIASGRQLIHQGSQKAGRAGLSHSVWMAGIDDFNFQSKFRIVSKDTFTARKENSPWIPGSLSVIDEVDVCLSPIWKQIHETYPYMIGLTATPCDGSGLGLGEHFDEMIIGAQYSELIKSGRLVDVPESKCFSPYRPDLTGAKLSGGDFSSPWLSGRMNTDKLVGNVVDEWRKHGEDKPTLVCCVDKAHSAHVCEEFNGRGIPAEYVIDETPQDQREDIFRRTENGDNKVIVNCATLTRGWDLPCIACLVLAKPTKRLRTYLQMAGRVLRADPTKEYAILIDHSGSVWRHGWPTEDREWTLDGETTAEELRDKKKAAEQAPPERFCPNCAAIIKYAKICPNCGYQKLVKSQAAETVDGVLVKVKRAAVKNANSKDEKGSIQKQWLSILAKMAYSGRSYACASAIFKDNTGKWPSEAGVGPTAQQHEWQRPVSSLWPGFCRSKRR